MAKLMCKKCGGKVTKMGNGGVTPSKAIPRASMGLNFGIPQTGTTNYSAPTMKKGGAIKKYKDGGDPGDGKPNSVLKNLGIFGGAGALLGLLTTQKGIDRRAKKAEARYEKRKLKKALPKYPAIKEGLQENVQDSKSKYGGRVKKK
jgi:hypothetical protein